MEYYVLFVIYCYSKNTPKQWHKTIATLDFFSQNSAGDWAYLESSILCGGVWDCSHLETQLGYNVQEGSVTWLAVGTGFCVENQLRLSTGVN